jgi:hypothetical protein
MLQVLNQSVCVSECEGRDGGMVVAFIKYWLTQVI